MIYDDDINDKDYVVEGHITDIEMEKINI